MHLRAAAVGLAGGLFVALAPPAQRSAASTRFNPTLHIQPSPSVESGEMVHVSITAPAWPYPMTARVWFASTSHHWQGDATWQRGCRCFAIARQLEPIPHANEIATVRARLTWRDARGTHTWWLSSADNSSGGVQGMGETVIGYPLVAGPTIVPQLGGGGTSEYVVQPGDTLVGIASAHGLSLSKLEAANPQIKDFNRIYVGETIYLGR